MVVVVVSIGSTRSIGIGVMGIGGSNSVRNEKKGDIPCIQR